MPSRTPFWSAVNAILFARNQPAASDEEIALYGRFIDKPEHTAWRLLCDHLDAGTHDYGERGRAAHAAIQRERHNDFMNSERYP